MQCWRVTRGPRLDVRLVEHAPTASCCLRFIDPWGDTTFNQQQIEVLFEELQPLAEVATPDVRMQAEALVRFISRARGVVHTYVKFIGD